MRARGFTLIELVTALALATIVAAAAYPTYASRATAARRVDATAALQRLQFAQERHRALHGAYADDATVLGVSTRSPEGLYALSWQTGPGEGYRAVARPLAGGLQASDAECAEISLQVEQGFATPGPSRRCWNR